MAEIIIGSAMALVLLVAIFQIIRWTVAVLFLAVRLVFSLVKMMALGTALVFYRPNEVQQ